MFPHLESLLLVSLLAVVMAATPPNVVLFLVDDLGYGDLTPYGHPTSNTPHIQLLAEQGLVFTQFYTTSPICSPSRAALLTGRYQTRSGIYPGVFEPNDLGGLPHNETTIAEGLKEIGYTTGMIGKWHLGVGADGEYLPDHHGFDYYMGIPYTHDACPCYVCFYPKQWCSTSCSPEYVPCPVYECKDGKQEIVQQPADLTTLSANLAMAAANFVDKQAGSGKPFFLYYAFQHMHAPQFSGQKFRNSSKRGNYGDSLREVNWAVSQVLQALSNTGVSDNTVIFLTADNGPDLSQGDNGGSAGPLRCGKASTWEGGMRVPSIAWWPNKIRHGRTHQLASTLDLLPTIFSMAGQSSLKTQRSMEPTCPLCCTTRMEKVIATGLLISPSLPTRLEDRMH
ncbi:arylsulfatase A-like [Halichondria panicea]|uniref:arylsulfatase A-like n=1 Tax=Halichondria panicea TaxID=6063 RepID=UPI00312B700A